MHDQGLTANAILLLSRLVKRSSCLSKVMPCSFCCTRFCAQMWSLKLHMLIRVKLLNVNAGLIFRMEGSLAKGKGHTVKGFGPIKNWRLRFEKGTVQVRASTAFRVEFPWADGRT